MRGDFLLWDGKIEMSFPTSRAKRRTILQFSPGRQKKSKVFQAVEKMNNNVSEFGENKYMCTNEMGLSVFFIDLCTKIIFVIIIKCIS